MPKGLRFQGFGDRIRHRMEVVGIRSQAELAARLGEGAPNVSRWITENALPVSIQKLEQLAAVLDVSVCWLLLGERGIEEVRTRGKWASEGGHVSTHVRARRGRHSGR
jgi:transcriptional regulator with XRE-family HTH domain